MKIKETIEEYKVGLEQLTQKTDIENNTKALAKTIVDLYDSSY
ncbi:MAG TPA: hypothetical protein OIM49_07430 [Clostridiaceae bacterium]|nr:hypothetical protein [Clostridiaceae bacterium]